MRLAIITILLLASYPIHAQARPEGQLIDETGFVQCDEFLARTDNFFLQLNNNPHAKAYLIIGGDDRELLRKLAMEQLFRSAVIQRRYDLGDVIIVRSRSSGDLRIQMWLVPKGVNPPDFEQRTADLRLPHGQPLLLRTDDDHICMPAPLEPVARDLLDADPAGRIYSVIYGESVRKRRIEMGKAMAALSRFPRNRVRFIRRSSQRRLGADYWFVSGTPKRTEVTRW